MASSKLFDVTGLNAIVTGAAMGIGFGIAAQLVDGGANVLLVDRDEAALAKAMTRLTGPGRTASLTLDVGADDAGARAVTACVNAFGSVTTLVNNAGIFPQTPLLRMTPEAFDRVYRVNLRGLAFMSAAVGRYFVEQKHGGTIVNIGSVDSVHPSMIGLAAYDASKGGVLMLTRNFALEMAPHNVRVNAVLPGGVTTEGTTLPLEGSGMSTEQQQQMIRGFIEQKIPMRRMGQPEDIAGAVVFLASRASSYMTGASIVVDGGMLLT